MRTLEAVAHEYSSARSWIRRAGEIDPPRSVAATRALEEALAHAIGPAISIGGGPRRVDPRLRTLNVGLFGNVDVVGDAHALPFRESSVGAIHCEAVLEHLAEPKQFLEKAWTLLKPQGLCFVLVPNLESLAARVLGGRYRYFYPQHLNYFSRTTLARIVQDRFGVIEMRSTHFNPIALWQDWRGGGAEVSNRERAELLQRTTAYKQNPWLAPAKLFYRLVESALGRLRLADNLAAVLRKAG